MSIKEKLRQNTLAIQTLLENTSGQYSKKEIEIIKGWQGSGHMKGLLYGDGDISIWEGASTADKALYSDYMRFYQVLDDNLTGKQYRSTIESLKNSILTQYVTPAVVCSTFYDVLSHYTSVESMLDPSAGMGVFITEALSKLSLNNGVTAYEKDELTSKLLTAVMSNEEKVEVYNVPFEESDKKGNGVQNYDLVATNPPYGAISIYDPECKDRNMTSKVHVYFVWKGLQKVREGGIMAYLISNAFLDTVSNKSAREYLFTHSDFISLTVMPDNLMHESAGTMAPSHFLVVRKNSNKTEMSDEEKLLCVSEIIQIQGVTIAQNKYIQQDYPSITIGDTRIGKNQYGKPAREVWWAVKSKI